MRAERLRGESGSEGGVDLGRCCLTTQVIKEIKATRGRDPTVDDQLVVLRAAIEI
jgi:hypothetical protein